MKMNMENGNPLLFHRVASVYACREGLSEEENMLAQKIYEFLKQDLG